MPATSRATVVLPVPGLPLKIMCRVIVGAARPASLRSPSTRSTAACRWISAFTAVSPTRSSSSASSSSTVFGGTSGSAGSSGFSSFGRLGGRHLRRVLLLLAALEALERERARRLGREVGEVHVGELPLHLTELLQHAGDQVGTHARHRFPLRRGHEWQRRCPALRGHHDLGGSSSGFAGFAQRQGDSGHLVQGIPVGVGVRAALVLQSGHRRRGSTAETVPLLGGDGVRPRRICSRPVSSHQSTKAPCGAFGQRSRTAPRPRAARSRGRRRPRGLPAPAPRARRLATGRSCRRS